jgi:hypothetical protein
MGVINFAAALAEATNFDEPVPVGQYDCYAAKCTRGTTKKGDLSFKVSWKIMAGEHANRAINDWYHFIPSNADSLGFFFRDMAVLGFPREYWAAATQLDPDQVVAEITARRPQARLTLTPPEGGRKFPDVSIEPVPGGAYSAAPTPGASVAAAPATINF